MKTCESSRLRFAMIALLALLPCLASGISFAADDAPPAVPGKSVKIQEFDDPAAPLVPNKLRSADEQKRIDAVSWFASGRVLETRNQFPNALHAYQEALKQVAADCLTRDSPAEAVTYFRAYVNLNPIEERGRCS